MKRALPSSVFLALAAAGGCSFLCIPGGNCITDCDCGAGFVCSADAGGVCVLGSGDAGCAFTPSSATGTGTSGFTTSAGTTGATTNGSGTTTGGTTSGGSCAESRNCCGTNWATGDGLCGGGLGSTVPGSLYVTTNNTFGIYQFHPGSPATTTLLAQSKLSENLEALTVVPGGSTPTFVYILDEVPLQLAESINGAETALPSFGEEAPAAFGLAFLPGSNLLALGGAESLSAYAFPPSNGAWGPDLWANANSGVNSGYSFPLGQMVLTGTSQNTLAAGSAVGGVTLASDGNVCYSEGCVVPPGLDGSPLYTGAAVDFSSGTLYVVGTYSDENEIQNGVVSAVDTATGACLWTTVGNASACNAAGALPFTCNGNCTNDSSLFQNPLLQAGFLDGTLYVTELGLGGGGPIASYSKAAGLQVQLQDNTYFSMAVGL